MVTTLPGSTVMQPRDDVRQYHLDKAHERMARIARAILASNRPVSWWEQMTGIPVARLSSWLGHGPLRNYPRPIEETLIALVLAYPQEAEEVALEAPLTRAQIRKIRTDTGGSVAAFCELFGVTPQQYYRWTSTTDPRQPRGFRERLMHWWYRHPRDVLDPARLASTWPDSPPGETPGAPG